MLNGIPSLIIGNLGRDPEFQTVNGKQIARISIGVTPRVKKGGDWQDAPTLWYRVTIWDTYPAEHVLNSLHKGDRAGAYGVVTSDFGFYVIDVDTDDKGRPIAVSNPLSGVSYLAFSSRFDHATREVDEPEWPNPEALPLKELKLEPVKDDDDE